MRGAPCVLAIGGLDPGGGAGVVADLRALHAVGVFGCAVVALVTVQSTDGLLASHPLGAKLVLEQAAEVVRAQRVGAIKLGALGSVANVRALAGWLASIRSVPVVLDPVMLPTRGRSRLLARRAVEALRDELLPCTTLVTANAPEAEALTGAPVRTLAEARRAARRLVELGASAALVKGGHLEASSGGGATYVVDVLALGRSELVELRGPRLALGPVHGGGCVLASLIAACLAEAGGRGRPAEIVEAVRRARRLHQRALRGSVDVGGALRVLVP